MPVTGLRASSACVDAIASYMRIDLFLRPGQGAEFHFSRKELQPGCKECREGAAMPVAAQPERLKERVRLGSDSIFEHP